MVVQGSSEQRERVAMSVERLNQSGDRIKESRRVMLETEELGISIVEDLNQQRETLLHSRNKVFYYSYLIVTNGTVCECLTLVSFGRVVV